MAGDLSMVSEKLKRNVSIYNFLMKIIQEQMSTKNCIIKTWFKWQNIIVNFPF